MVFGVKKRKNTVFEGEKAKNMVEKSKKIHTKISDGKVTSQNRRIGDASQNTHKNK